MIEKSEPEKDIVSFFKKMGEENAQNHFKTQKYALKSYHEMATQALLSGRVDIFEALQPHYKMTSGFLCHLLYFSLNEKHPKEANYLIEKYLMTKRHKLDFGFLSHVLTLKGWEFFEVLLPFSKKIKEEENQILHTVLNALPSVAMLTYFDKLCDLNQIKWESESNGDHKIAQDIGQYLVKKEHKTLQRGTASVVNSLKTRRL